MFSTHSLASSAANSARITPVSSVERSLRTMNSRFGFNFVSGQIAEPS